MRQILIFTRNVAGYATVTIVLKLGDTENTKEPCEY
jgi:hypothetical protein